MELQIAIEKLKEAKNVQDWNRIRENIKTQVSSDKWMSEFVPAIGASLSGFYAKLVQVAKHTTKVREWDGPKIVRRKLKEPVIVEKTEGIAMPEGVSLDFTSKRVTMHNDHVRIYF